MAKLDNLNEDSVNKDREEVKKVLARDEDLAWDDKQEEQFCLGCDRPIKPNEPCRYCELKNQAYWDAYLNAFLGFTL